MKSKEALFFVSTLTSAFVPVLGSCSGKKSGSAVVAGTVPFLAQDYSKGAVVYSYDVAKNEVTQIRVAEGNQDWKVFWDQTSQQTVVIDRTVASSTSASVITSYLGANVSGEVGGFPINTKFLIHSAAANTLIAGGYTGGTATFSLPTNRLQAVSSMNFPTGDGSTYYHNVVGLISGEKDVWALFGGTDSASPPNVYPAAVSKINLAASSFENVSTVTACLNIASGTPLPNEGVVALSRSRVVVSCNPQYGVLGAPIALVLFEANSTTAEVQVTVLKQAKSSADIHQYEISGSSADGNSVFVEEKIFDGSDFSTETRRRYWLNVLTHAETPVTQYGGHMFYDVTSGKYLFGCYIEKDTGKCRSHTFALVTPGNDNPEARSVSYEYDFHGFAEQIR